VSAAGLHLLGLGFVADGLRCLWKFGLELAESRAGRLLLAERCERHTELEQRLRCLIAGLVFLIALEEGVGRILVLAALASRGA